MRLVLQPCLRDVHLLLPKRLAITFTQTYKPSLAPTRRRTSWPRLGPKRLPRCQESTSMSRTVPYEWAVAIETVAYYQTIPCGQSRFKDYALIVFIWRHTGAHVRQLSNYADVWNNYIWLQNRFFSRNLLERCTISESRVRKRPASF